jgi:hypothetical protein
VRGWRVTRCFVDPGAFGLLVDGGTGDTLRLYLEGAFTLRPSSGAPGSTLGGGNHDPTSYAPLLHLLNAAISRVAISAEGDLGVDFESGERVEVAPDPDYEAWELEGLGRLIVVCAPGGGQPAIFNG